MHQLTMQVSQHQTQQQQQQQQQHLPQQHQQHPLPFRLVYPSSYLQQTTIENAKRIHHLEHLIRAERQELDRLLVQNASPSPKRTRHSSSSSSSAPATPPPTSSPHSLSSTMDEPTTPPVPTTPPALSRTTPHTSPKGIMYPYQTPQRKPQPREMAARGSHWSFVEKARFEAALHKYGPFAWDQIIRTVGTRSEKQVKAYAARYRRRKKLAAKAQIEAAERLPTLTSTPLPPSISPTHRHLSLSPTPPPSSSEEAPRSTASDASTLLEPLQLDNLMTSENSNFDDSTFCDTVFGANSLFDTPLEDNAVDLTEVDEHTDPSDVELMVDRALQGEFAMADKTDQEREGDSLGDDYPTEFLNTVFAH